MIEFVLLFYYPSSYLGRGSLFYVESHRSLKDYVHHRTGTFWLWITQYFTGKNKTFFFFLCFFCCCWWWQFPSFDTGRLFSVNASWSCFRGEQQKGLMPCQTSEEYSLTDSNNLKQLEHWQRSREKNKTFVFTCKILGNRRPKSSGPMVNIIFTLKSYKLMHKKARKKALWKALMLEQRCFYGLMESAHSAIHVFPSKMLENAALHKSKLLEYSISWQGKCFFGEIFFLSTQDVSSEMFNLSGSTRGKCFCCNSQSLHTREMAFRKTQSFHTRERINFLKHSISQQPRINLLNIQPLLIGGYLEKPMFQKVKWSAEGKENFSFVGCSLNQGLAVGSMEILIMVSPWGGGVYCSSTHQTFVHGALFLGFMWINFETK